MFSGLQWGSLLVLHRTDVLFKNFKDEMSCPHLGDVHQCIIGTNMASIRLGAL